MVTECLSIRSFGKHILDYYDTKEILLVFQKEKKIGKIFRKIDSGFWSNVLRLPGSREPCWPVGWLNRVVCESNAVIWSTKIYISVFTDSYGSGIFVDTVSYL